MSKRYERLVKGGSAKRSTNADEMTPRSRTNNQLREAGLNPKKADESLKRRLLFSNVLVDEIHESAQDNKTTAGKQAIRNIICGRIVKKYRLIRAMAGATKLARNSLMRSTSKSCTIQKRTRLLALYESKKEQVKVFLKRDDNSRMMPGKNDAKKSEGVKVQKRVLCGYLYNLHDKFLAENPSEKMSRATFCRLRPNHIVLAALPLPASPKPCPHTVCSERKRSNNYSQP